MKHGHIKVSRKSFDVEHGDDFWHEPRVFSKWEAWVDLLQIAQWKRRKHAGITLERGQFVASVRTLGARWSWSKSRVSRYLEAAEKSGRVTGHHTGHAGTVYRIVNYDAYQGERGESEPETGTETGTDAGQQRDKNKQEKQGKQKSSFPASVYDWLHHEWFARFGLVGQVEFRTGIKALLSQEVRPGQIARAFAAYREDRTEAKKDGKFAWFLGDVQRHIAEGDLCAIQLVDDPGTFGLTQAEANVKIAEHQERLRVQDTALYERITAVAA